MLQLETIESVREQIQHWKQSGLTIGFVPTMGNLHAGHLSLVKQAFQKADKVVVSIFVNPLQFGPDEDFERYPRTLDEDMAKLSSEGVDLVFCPSAHELYPEGQLQTLVKASESLSCVLEGEARPGHFDGVTTVVAKLFNIIDPSLAVFGQKDFQQWRIIQQMVTDLSFAVEVVRAPIARDEDGLALSSRNQYLSVSQRAIAPKLFVVLQDVATALRSGNHCFNDLEDSACRQLLSNGFDVVDYIRIVDANSLKPANQKTNTLAILAVARLGSTRLLDNIYIE